MPNLSAQLRFLILATLVVLTGGGVRAHAAAPVAHRISVHVVCSCDDAMGQSYISAFKAALRQDAHYVLDDAADADTAMRINIISMPITTAEGVAGDAFSIVCVHKGALMHQFVTTCAHIPIEDCARKMVTDLGDIA